VFQRSNDRVRLSELTDLFRIVRGTVAPMAPVGKAARNSSKAPPTKHFFRFILDLLVIKKDVIGCFLESGLHHPSMSGEDSSRERAVRYRKRPREL
jgi:hypothetical protein